MRTVICRARSSVHALGGDGLSRVRRLCLYPLAALAFALTVSVLAATVFACTGIMGPLTISPASGNAGTTITTSATGLKPSPATYKLVFEDSVSIAAGGSCSYQSPVVLVPTIPTDGQGSWNNVNATIPSNAPQGVSQVCGWEKYPVAGQTGTTHDTYTVLGGGPIVPPCDANNNHYSIWRSPDSGVWYQCLPFPWEWTKKATPRPPDCTLRNQDDKWTDTSTGYTYVCSRDPSTEEPLWQRLT